ncbi:hypothetical protein FQN60_003467, partial [Etheostoma spectabile]
MGVLVVECSDPTGPPGGTRPTLCQSRAAGITRTGCDWSISELPSSGCSRARSSSAARLGCFSEEFLSNAQLFPLQTNLFSMIFMRRWVFIQYHGLKAMST